MLLQLDFSSDMPIYLQIRNQVVLGIANGGLQSGEKLPAIRALADQAGVNMMTVNKAYQLLKQEGYISTDRRSGAIVSGGTMGKDIDERAHEGLRLIISESKLRGLSKQEFLALCAAVFDEMEMEA